MSRTKRTPEQEAHAASGKYIVCEPKSPWRFTNYVIHLIGPDDAVFSGLDLAREQFGEKYNVRLEHSEPDGRGMTKSYFPVHRVHTLCMSQTN